MSSLDKILEKANIPYHEQIITAAIEEKNASTKRFTNIIFGIVMFALGIFALYVGLNGLYVLFAASIHWVAIPFLVILVLLMAGICLVCIRISFQSISPESGWFLILYKNKLLYKYREAKGYEEINVPIQDIQRCTVMHKFAQGIRVKGRDMSEYLLAVHIEYVKNEKKQIISIYSMDGYDELNEIITYLTSTANIPFYYVEFEQGLREVLDDLEEIKKAEATTFSGDLKSYQKASSIHYLR